MKVLDGRDVADFIKERHQRQAAALATVPTLVIFHDAATPASAAYLDAKVRYGQDVDVDVIVREVPTEELEGAVEQAGSNPEVTGIIIQLPLADRAYEPKAIAAIPHGKDVDGLRSQTPYQSATPKGILWLLAAYNIDLKTKKIAVVGQGALVGKPLADALEGSGFDVIRLDDTVLDLTSALQECDVIISATGQPGLITSDMAKPGVVIVDAGSPYSELSTNLLARTDVIRTPNPGGVGPMTVAALFDNLLQAAGA
jgi:methylenetetrahydrofolate dehydrogenase (NADP+) / methenyltetrahydrofolate cyclohydrolase